MTENIVRDGSIMNTASRETRSRATRAATEHVTVNAREHDERSRPRGGRSHSVHATPAPASAARHDAAIQEPVSPAAAANPKVAASHAAVSGTMMRNQEGGSAERALAGELLFMPVASDPT